MAPSMSTKRDTIRRGAVDAVGLEIAHPNPLVAQRPRRSDRVTHRGLLDIRRDDAHLAEARRNFRQRRDARAVNAVVIRNQNSHLHTNKKRVSDRFWPNSFKTISANTACE